MDRTQLAALNEREKEVLRLLSQGFDVKACARELDISEGSVTERLREARKRLGATSSREAARLYAQFESDPHRFSGDRFSGIADAQFHQPHLVLPDVQAEAVEPAPFAVREQQASFAVFQGIAGGVDRLPLRKNGEIRNSLDKRERVGAIIDVSTKLAGIFALVCLIAILVNLLTERL
ncbi:MAG: LuxR C-terminal-related transcriptional regulator [Sphingomonadaceae bacterium]